MENNSSVPWTFFFQRGANPCARTRFDWYLMAAEQGGLRKEWLKRNKWEFGSLYSLQTQNYCFLHLISLFSLLGAS